MSAQRFLRVSFFADERTCTGCRFLRWSAGRPYCELAVEPGAWNHSHADLETDGHDALRSQRCLNSEMHPQTGGTF